MLPSHPRQVGRTTRRASAKGMGGEGGGKNIDGTSDGPVYGLRVKGSAGQIEGPIFAEQKGNKLTLRTSVEGGGVGRSVDAAWPLFGRRHFASQSWPTLRRPPLPPVTHPCLPPTIRRPPPRHLRRPIPFSRPSPAASLPRLPCCALSVSPFPKSANLGKRPRGSSSLPATSTSSFLPPNPAHPSY